MVVGLVGRRMKPRFVVVSTAFNAPTEMKCRVSVSSQEDVGIVEHRYINAGAQAKPAPVVVNLIAMIANLPKETVVVWLDGDDWRSEEHTSELQSHSDIVCRLLLEKKKR